MTTKAKSKVEKKCPKSFKVVVTKEHIKNGKPSTSNLCPIALAIRDLGHKHVGVDYDISIKHHGHKCRYYLGKKADGFIDAFDSGKEVKPFSFTAKFSAKYDL